MSPSHGPDGVQAPLPFSVLKASIGAAETPSPHLSTWSYFSCPLPSWHWLPCSPLSPGGPISPGSPVGRMGVLTVLASPGRELLFPTKLCGCAHMCACVREHRAGGRELWAPSLAGSGEGQSLSEPGEEGVGDGVLLAVFLCPAWALGRQTYGRCPSYLCCQLVPSSLGCLGAPAVLQTQTPG